MSQAKQTQLTDGMKFLIGATTLLAAALFVYGGAVSAQEAPSILTNTEQQQGTTAPTTAPAVPAGDPAVADLSRQIAEKQAQIEELRTKTELYQQNIKIKQQEALTIETQIGLLDEQIGSTETELSITQAEIESVSLKIKEIEITIAEREAELLKKKELMADFLQRLYIRSQKSYLEIALTNDRFSDFYVELKEIEAVEDDLRQTYQQVVDLKAELEAVNAELGNRKGELVDKEDQVLQQQDELVGQQEFKQNLLDETEESEAKFQELVQAVQEEQFAAQNEISALESSIRRRLSGGQLGSDDTSRLSWPVSASRGISAYFHDPTYIFRGIFEHPAIDIPTSQGTPVAAAADGIVAACPACTRDVGPGYSYILIVHDDHISTVYGHLNQVNVEVDQFVSRGQIIGLSGGIRGTTGAGRLTTGAHLHFEVRLDAIPVDPLDYLPQ